jgi:hypothetical protein
MAIGDIHPSGLSLPQHHATTTWRRACRWLAAVSGRPDPAGATCQSQAGSKQTEPFLLQESRLKSSNAADARGSRLISDVGIAVCDFPRYTAPGC